jgi:hypothetical protein
MEKVVWKVIRSAALLLGLASPVMAELPLSIPTLALEVTTPNGWRVDALSTSDALILRRSRKRLPVLRVFLNSSSDGSFELKEMFALVARRIGGDERLISAGESSPLEGEGGRTGTVFTGASEDGALHVRFVHVPNPDGSSHLFWLTAHKSPMRKAWQEVQLLIHGSRFLAPEKPAPKAGSSKSDASPPPPVWRDPASGLYFTRFPEGFGTAPGTSGDFTEGPLRLEPVDEEDHDRASITLYRRVVSPNLTARSIMDLLLGELNKDDTVLKFTYSPTLVANRSAWKVDWVKSTGQSTEGHTLWLFQRDRNVFSVEWKGEPAWKKEHSGLLRSFVKAIGLPEDD